MRLHLWDYPVDALTQEEAVERLISGWHMGRGSRIITLNPEMLMAAEVSPALKEAILTADLVIPDGVGIVWALRRQGQPIFRLTGVDLAYRLMGVLNGSGGSIYLLGGTPGVAEEAGARISRNMPGIRIVGSRNGYLSAEEEPAIVDEIARIHPDLLLVGMGTPRQDVWLARYWEGLNVPIGLGIGGGLDLWAGRVRRAPRFWIEMNLEWFYRVLTQPGRWGRLNRLPAFIWRVVSCRGRERKG